MNDVVHRRQCPEVLPDGRQPRRCDALDVARETIAMIDHSIFKVALYVLPSGAVLRVSNPSDLNDEDAPSLVGVYDESARETDIVEDILELAAA